MSGIYISMEMPENCHECELVDVLVNCPCRMMPCDEFWGNSSLAVEGHKDCPLIPVPDHGRLIDGDALSEEHRKRAYETNGGSYQFHITAKAWVDEAPTIIPADKEGEG